MIGIYSQKLIVALLKMKNMDYQKCYTKLYANIKQKK